MAKQRQSKRYGAKLYAAVLLNVVALLAIYFTSAMTLKKLEESEQRRSILNHFLHDLERVDNELGSINAPGNEIFSSGKVEEEHRQLNDAVSRFTPIIEDLITDTAEAKELMPEFTQLKLLEIRNYSRRMVNLTNEILDLYAAKKMTLASKRMSEMDQTFRSARTTSTSLRESWRSIAHEFDITENTTLRKYTWFGKVILGCSIASIMILVFAGHLAARSEKMSARLADFYQYALDQAAIIAFTDRRGVITHVNDAFTRISGYSRDELIGKTHRVVNSGKMGKEFFSQMWRTISSGKVWTGDICNVTKDNHLYWVDSTIVPLVDSDGQIIQYIAIRKDISEKKKQERELIEAKQIADKAASVKSQFLANMSHEIRTPLNGILGMIDLISSQNLNSEGKKYLDVMRQSGETLLALVNDILDFSKIEAGKLNLEIISFNLNDIIQDTVSLLFLKAKDKGLVVSTEQDPLLPTVIQSDATRIRQVLINLLSNAIKFTSHGSIRIKTTSKVLTLDKVEIRIDVIDTGTGLSEDAQKKLFMPFSQIDASTTRKFGGTGLGLSICRGICEALGGRIWVESEEGRGSVFSFTFVAETGSNNKAVEVLTSLPPSTSEFSSLPALQILVADDHPTNQLIAIKFLEQIGYRAEVVSNGLEVLAALESRSFDVIFMDGHMPELDGYETTRLIRKKTGFSAESPWIIACTASTHIEDRNRCLACGMNDFVAKPFNLKTVAAALKRVPSKKSE